MPLDYIFDPKLLYLRIAKEAGKVLGPYALALGLVGGCLGGAYSLGKEAGMEEASIDSLFFCDDGGEVNEIIAGDKRVLFCDEGLLKVINNLK